MREREAFVGDGHPVVGVIDGELGVPVSGDGGVGVEVREVRDGDWVDSELWQDRAVVGDEEVKDVEAECGHA